MVRVLRNGPHTHIQFFFFLGVPPLRGGGGGGAKYGLKDFIYACSTDSEYKKKHANEKIEKLNY